MTEKYYLMIAGLRIDDIVRVIMYQKKSVGEFSMDLYYDDVAADWNKRYVAKLFFPGGELADTYYRCESFMWALSGVVETMDNLGTDIVKQLNFLRMGSEPRSDRMISFL